MKGIFPTLMGSNNSTPFGVASQFRRGSFRRFHLRLIILFPFGEQRWRHAALWRGKLAATFMLSTVNCPYFWVLTF